MQTIADGVIRVPLAPRAALNAFVLGDNVLVDTGLPFQRRRLQRLLRGSTIERIVLTHAHIDHAGTVAALSAEYGCEVHCGTADLADLAAGVSPPIALPRATIPLQRAIVRYRGLRANALRDGDDVGHGFVAIETRGHSPGHHALWRESDGVLIAGDALFGFKGLKTGVFAPPKLDQPDPESCRRSIIRLAELRPNIIAFGHGPAVVDGAAHQLSALAASLG
jgi:hydroxyacylglutathione hydrolase